jgi:16S rRNA (guanine527-N7)-methyltransferase
MPPSAQGTPLLFRKLCFFAPPKKAEQANFQTPGFPFTIWVHFPMDTARIAQLLEPFLRFPTEPGNPPQAARPAPEYSHGENNQQQKLVLSETQLKTISTYIDILMRWNSRINLTGIRDPEQIVTRHFGESLFAARHLFPPSSSLSSGMNSVSPARTLADIGSGAGFPGLAIKIAIPALSLTLIESSHKKSTFLREVTRALTLTDVNVQTARAETIFTTFDVVTLRAVERFEAVLPTAARLVAPTGRLALLIGSSQQAQTESQLPNLRGSNSLPIPLSDSRILLIASRS